MPDPAVIFRAGRQLLGGTTLDGLPWRPRAGCTVASLVIEA
jgi:hypothetical protein